MTLAIATAIVMMVRTTNHRTMTRSCRKKRACAGGINNEDEDEDEDEEEVEVEDNSGSDSSSEEDNSHPNCSEEESSVSSNEKESGKRERKRKLGAYVTAEMLTMTVKSRRKVGLEGFTEQIGSSNHHELMGQHRS